MKEELYSYVKTVITEKGFDEFTSKKILDYVESHNLLYGHIINTKDVVDRISENLNGNIQFDFEKGGYARGGYGPVHRKIEIFTKDFGDDEYFHEIDHCATSDLSTMPDYDAPDAWDDVAIDKRYREGHKIYMGIEVSGQEPSGPNFNVAKNENEGITTLKQRDYAKLKGLSFSQNGYDINYNIAEQMGYIIGRDNLLQKHFYNDVNGIRRDFSKHGIDYDELLNLSEKFQNTDQLSLDFYERLNNPNKREEFKIVYQNIMAHGFISRRCQELGIVDTNSYYQKLTRNQRKIELQKLDEFEQFKICDSSVLEHIRSELQPKSILQTITNFFANIKNKRLPETTTRFDEQSNFDNDSALKPWDLANWDIDIEQFRQESYQTAQNSLTTPENSMQNDIQINQKIPGDISGHEHTH